MDSKTSNCFLHKKTEVDEVAQEVPLLLTANKLTAFPGHQCKTNMYQL